MTDAKKPKKLQRKTMRQCSHAMSFVTTIKTFDSSTAFEELENYSNCLQVDLQNLISPDDCIRDLPNDKSTYTAPKARYLRPTVLFETRVEILHCKLQVTNGVPTHTYGYSGNKCCVSSNQNNSMEILKGGLGF
jgi:hypothetical protein